ncbi:TlpA family protein disulfide reductase [Streptomyces sp. NPDC013457]|uniref:TlpA family protein disulfide reductase n=1 Tax=Streptomyces sp. NPDC013457 TaxID=3364866 RepID=UPI0036F5B7F8
MTLEGGISTVAKGKRAEAGTLAGETVDGEKLDVADLEGKVVVLNVWGSWCPPCRAEAPHFAKVAKELKGKGVEFVDTPVTSTSSRPGFEDDFGVSYPSLYDPHGKLILKGFPKGTLVPHGISSTVVLDREGRIAASSLQALYEGKLRSMVDPLVAEK